jgi:putative FmdB family regulatory protein
MPIYEYECTSCHHHFELIQKFNELPIKQCSQCFQNTATRLVSAPSFQLKGSGWYATLKIKKSLRLKEKPRLTRQILWPVPIQNQ